MAILIVDDVRVTRKIIESFLKDAGYTEVIHAESAEKAVGAAGARTALFLFAVEWTRGRGTTERIPRRRSVVVQDGCLPAFFRLR